MKFSESWLRAYCNPAIDSNELADRLTMAGLEVEGMEPVATFSGIVAAKVVGVVPHPNADRLRVCQVDAGEKAADGSAQLRQIVCGAPNVAEGMTVPCALPGAVLKGAKGAFTIGETVMRGVESKGMLCSANELNLPVPVGADGKPLDGLLPLPATMGAGTDLRAALELDDLVFELKLTPNRADCLSLGGIAREVAALTGAPLAMPAVEPVPVTIDDRVAVKVEAPDLCGRFAGRVIRGVNARAKTPEWMVQRLERSGQRSISALVDLSNYLMLELGQPTHVFDLAKVDASAGLTVRWAKDGETLKLLNGQTVTLTGDVGVIADSRGVESLAGVMGGDSTAVSLDTTDIYVEAAFWWPTAIAGRARRFRFSTDAAHRFERGVDAERVAERLEALSRLIIDVCGGQAGPVDDQVVRLPARPAVTMRVSRAERILGCSLSLADCVAVFEGLGMAHTADAAADGGRGTVTVVPPSWRFDLAIEEDLVEEVARVRGFDALPQRPPLARASMAPVPEARLGLSALKRRIADRDYQEAIGFSFVSSATEAAMATGIEPIRLLNPIAEQLDVMRTTLVGGLVETLRANLNRRAERVRLFEAGRVFRRDASASAGPLDVAGVVQPLRIAGLAWGDAVDAQWGEPARAVDFFDVKGDLEAIVAPAALACVAPAASGATASGASGAEAGQGAAPAMLHPGRCARVRIDGVDAGWLGELHPKLVQQFELQRAPVVFELDLPVLQGRPMPKPAEPSKFPSAVRDVALVVDREVASGAAAEALRAGAESVLPGALQDLKLFDEYRGKGLENKEKSLAFRLRFQDNSRTLNDDEVERAMQAATDRAVGSLGARLRG